MPLITEIISILSRTMVHSNVRYDNSRVILLFSSFTIDMSKHTKIKNKTP